MRTFREVNTLQVVSTDDEERIAYFTRWARWEEIEGEPEKKTRRKTRSRKQEDDDTPEVGEDASSEDTTTTDEE